MDMSMAVVIIGILLAVGAFIWAVQTWLDMVSPPFRNVICFVAAIFGIWAIGSKLGLF